MKSVKELVLNVLNKHTLKVHEIAKRHGTSVKAISKALKQGIEVEAEHTSNRTAQREIALDHLGEDPNYYKKLSKIEKKR